ncbi:hypothetical protein L1887_08307 [Cichorium endivia]|nr:hypothetical protein L1887_08307 [Cichorium endivia]
MSEAWCRSFYDMAQSINLLTPCLNPVLSIQCPSCPLTMAVQTPPPPPLLPVTKAHNHNLRKSPLPTTPRSS